MAFTKAQLEALKNSLLASNQPISASIHREFAQKLIDEMFDAQSRGDLLAGVQEDDTLIAGDLALIIREGEAFIIPVSALIAANAARLRVEIFNFSSSNVFELNEAPFDVVYVSLNGQTLSDDGLAWTLSGNDLTINYDLLAGDFIQVCYSTNPVSLVGIGAAEAAAIFDERLGIQKDQDGGIAANDTSLLSVNTIEGIASTPRRNRTRLYVNDLNRGGLFSFVASGVTANGGTVFEANGGGFWVRNFTGPVSVKWFNGKGDGVTDDTAAIQAAINSNAPEILLPAGTYVHTLTELGDGQTLRGEGPGKSILKLKNGVAAYYSIVGILGLTAKSGITSCAIRDLEYDGNAQNNRSWGSGSSSWGPTEYDLIYTQGVYFGNLDGRVAPLRALVDNVYIHDTVRSCIVWGTTQLTLTNSRFKNSDADHLIYESDGTKSLISNCVLEGFYRDGALVICEGSQASNLVFSEAAPNPTIYDCLALINIRNAGYTRRANLDNLSIFIDTTGLAPSSFSIFTLTGQANVNGLSLDVLPASALPVFFTNLNFGLGARGGLFMNNFSIYGAPAGSALTVCFSSVAGLCKGLRYTNGLFNFRSGAAGTAALLQVNQSLEDLKIEGLTVTGTQAGTFLVTAAAITAKDFKFENIVFENVNGRVATTISRQNIIFKDCDFQGAAITDLVSTSFFDQVNAFAVKTGDRLYSNNGDFVASGNGSTVNFTIPHGLETTPTSVQVTAFSADARGLFNVTANGTNLIVTYSTAPPSGTNNVRLSWFANVTKIPV